MSGLSCTVARCTGMVMPLAAMPPCQFCSKPFCIAHRMPESHGCADAARNKAHMDNTVAANAKREEVRKLGRGDAEDKLAKKREELAQQRQKKPTAKQASKGK